MVYEGNHVVVGSTQRRGIPHGPCRTYQSLLFWSAVDTGRGVQAVVVQAEAFDRLSADDVGVNDFVDVGLGDRAIPDGVRINHDIWTVLALVQASGLVGTDAAFESAGS